MWGLEEFVSGQATATAIVASSSSITRMIEATA